MPRKTCIVLIMTLLVALFQSQLLAQNITREQYIETYKSLAIKKMEEHGIPASITLAQGILESNSGNSTLARRANNHFGIKCHKDWKGQTYYHNDDRPNECFRKYKSAEGSYEDHSLFLRGYSRYAFLFDLPATDYKSWARGLKKAGYATASAYAEMLIRVIEENNLQRFDTGVDVAVESPTKGTGDQYGIINKQGKVEKRDGTQLASDESSYTIDMYNVRKVYIRNRIKYIKVREGDTFEKLTRELNMMPYQLYKYNELGRSTVLTEGQELYIQPKRRKAEINHKVHVAEAGETMYQISQKYGIKLKSLYRLNAMDKGNEPEEGQFIYLRRKKK